MQMGTLDMLPMERLYGAKKKRCALLGAVSMDMLTIDISDCGDVKLGERVVMGQNLPVDEVAQAAGTIGYELLCALAKEFLFLMKIK